MTESQKAFEAAYPHYDQRLSADGKYHSRASQDAYTYFTKGVAYGRKQALEDALVICKDICSPFPTDAGNGYNEAALDCEKAIKELIK